MRVIIPSYGRSDTITTPHVLEDGGVGDYVVVLHSDAEKASYAEAGRVDMNKVVVAHLPKGIAQIRNWILDNLLSDGEWALSLDDNIRGFYVASPEIRALSVVNKDDKGMLGELKVERDAGSFMGLAEEVKQRCEDYNLSLGGFATVDNPYFRSRQWRYVGFVIGQAMVMQKTNIRHDENIDAMADYEFTAQHLLQQGGVVINNFGYPIKGHYEDGGVGTWDERLQAKIHASAYLLAKYPDLYRYKAKKGKHPKSEVQMRFTSTKQVQRWRERMFSGEAYIG